MNKDVGPIIRVLAYIDRFEPVDCSDRGAIGWLMDDTRKGYWLDVSVEIDQGQGSILMEHLGDGKVYATLEEAEDVVRQETGLTLCRVPESSDPTGWTCVAFLVYEFAATDKSEPEVAAASTLPARNPDRSRKVERRFE